MEVKRDKSVIKSFEIGYESSEKKCIWNAES